MLDISRNNRRLALVAFAVGASALVAAWALAELVIPAMLDGLFTKPGRGFWIDATAWANAAFMAGALVFVVAFVRGRHIAKALGAWTACGAALAVASTAMLLTFGASAAYRTAAGVVAVVGISAWGARVLGPDPEAHD